SRSSPKSDSRLTYSESGTPHASAISRKPRGSAPPRRPRGRILREASTCTNAHPLPFSARCDGGIEDCLAADAIQQRRTARLAESHTLDELKFLVIAISPSRITGVGIAGRSRHAEKLGRDFHPLHRAGRISAVLSHRDPQRPRILQREFRTTFG